MKNVTVPRLEWMNHEEIIDSKEEGMLADKRRDACNVIPAKQQNWRSFNFIEGHLSLLLYFMSKKHSFTEKEKGTQRDSELLKDTDY